MNQPPAGIPPQGDKPDAVEGGMGERWRAAAGIIVALYPWHKAVFIGLNAALTLLNLYFGKPWWALWPLLITGFIFMVHYLTYKSLTVDDAWVDERAAELYDKSYDQAQIDSIAERNDMETIAERLERERRTRAVKAKDGTRLLGRDE